jgi:hypothetical protein
LRGPLGPAEETKYPLASSMASRRKASFGGHFIYGAVAVPMPFLVSQNDILSPFEQFL